MSATSTLFLIVGAIDQELNSSPVFFSLFWRAPHVTYSDKAFGPKVAS